MIEFVRKHPDAVLPSRATDGSAGFDLHALRADSIPPMGYRTIKTGIAAAIPAGHAGLICPRSGLAAKEGLTVLNGPGVIDADYRGEIGILLHNTSESTRYISPGQRVAQLVVVPFVGEAVEVGWLDDTDRGENGFGSTGA